MADQDDDLAGPGAASQNRPTAGNPDLLTGGKRGFSQKIVGWFGELSDNAELRSARDRRVMRVVTFLLFLGLTAAFFVPPAAVFYRYAFSEKLHLSPASYVEDERASPRLRSEGSASRDPIPRLGVSPGASATSTPLVPAAKAAVGKGMVVEAIAPSKNAQSENRASTRKDMMPLMITLLILMVTVPISLAFGLIRIASDPEEKSSDGPTTPQLEAIKALVELAKGK
ncbi:hypothetical protein [Novilysobacter erysipheiresistens]|uniref:Uncharacterized protein n=1 Tax=Novilysobacter erysipheiresistens TaxID=1749332 RepID=A0ABU7Z010_9GAMM